MVQRISEIVLIDAPIDAGTVVVTEGVQSVREGGGVRIAGGATRALGADG